MTEQNNNCEKESSPNNQNSQTKNDPGPSCCSPEVIGEKTPCPCGSFFKKHPLRIAFFFSVMLLMFLISQVGGILGITAFIRTL